MSDSARVFEVVAGADLGDALSSLPEGTWVQAVGQVDAVEVSIAGDGTPVRALRGKHSLVALNGPARGPWGVTLSRVGESGPVVTAGLLVRAKSAGVWCVTLAGGVPAPRPSEAARPEAARPEAAKAEAGALDVKAAQGWAEVAAASSTAVDEEDEPWPMQGDLVEHFSFGLCEVLVSDGERIKIRDLGPARRIRELSIEALRVMPPTSHGGKRLFKLQRR